MPTPTLQSWMEHLRVLMPPQHITLLGAGAGGSPWIHLLAQWHIENATLIEGDDQQFARLQQTAEIHPKWQLHHQVISQAATTTQFFRTSIPGENGLLSPTQLQSIWPNLTLVEVQEKAAVTLDSLYQNRADSPAGKAGQWLIIDCLQALAMLQSAAVLLGHANVVVVRSLIAKSDLDVISSYLAKSGFQQVCWQAGRHPQIGHALFTRDYQAMPASDDEVRAQRVTWLDREKSLLDRIDELTALSEEQASKLKKAGPNIRTVVDQAAQNIKSQVAAMLGAEHFLQTGLLPVISAENNGWPISPDLSLYLIELLATTPYDLIIEFGSGYSTALIAKTLDTLRQYQPQRPTTRHVAFEHLETYFEKTSTHVRHAVPDSARHALSIIHAPLANYKATNGSTYPYYTCQEALQSIGQEFVGCTGLRALIVVDGPPAATGPHARYPAMPIVRTIFSDWDMDFLLDDYRRDDEKEIAQLWQDELRDQGLSIQLKKIPLERQACLIQARHSPA